MFEIKVLKNDEFDNLPLEVTRGSEIHDSLGFADQRTGKAYVRYTSHPELQKYLINHELEELMMAESSHEDENGIRHKKGPKFFKDIFLPLFGQVAGSAITGGDPTGGAAGGALASLFSGGNKGQSQQQQNPYQPIIPNQQFSQNTNQQSGPMGYFNSGQGVPTGQTGSSSTQGAGGNIIGSQPNIAMGLGNVEQDPWKQYYSAGAPSGRLSF